MICNYPDNMRSGETVQTRADIGLHEARARSKEVFVRGPQRHVHVAK